MAANVTVPRKTWPRLSYRVATPRKPLSLLIARSTTLRFLYRSLSKPGGRPPCEPRLTRFAAWSAFWDHVPDTPLAQVGPGPAVAVRLIGTDAVRSPAGPPGAGPRNADLLHDRLELRAVRPLPGRDQQGQRPTPAIGTQVDFGGEPVPRAAQALTCRTTSARWPARPFPRRIDLVFHHRCPPLRTRAEALCEPRRRADGRASPWNRPRCPSRWRPRRPRRPEPAGEAAPRSRRPTTAHASCARSSTDRTAQADHATARRSAPDAGPR